eukprot:CAMPEP_0114525638 /NCGR_PEP_ID=MMETSP0109-20121206/22544_1 /TAXON_ID=29199 /ORGANISM="Chlorarachnion reptans, Strain CCCM449" /LENGTH=129 /DNA_ID=CAMNT_0001707259 /DNA_START=139 /DNA_END=528 /DNA_ORIENTATION=-
MSEKKLKTSGKIKIKDPAKEGWLEKQSRFLKTWRKRWFVLDGHVLYSFKEEKVYENPTEVIDLSIYNSVKSSEQYTNRKNSFDVASRENVFSMVASSSAEKEDWIRKVGSIIVKKHTQWQSDDYGEDSD